MTNTFKSRTYFWYDTVYPNHRTAKVLGRRRIGALAIDSENRILIATAVCSEKDQFVKKTGRQKAQGRLTSLLHRIHGNGMAFGSIQDVLNTNDSMQTMLFGGPLPITGERPLIQHLVELATKHPL